MADFSYDGYRAMLIRLLESFEFYLFAEAPVEFVQGHDSKRKLFLRHDVDLSLEHAYRMALIEDALGVRSTFMILPFSRIYRLDSARSREILQEMQTKGHELGLHLSIELGEEIPSWDSLPLLEQMHAHRRELEARLETEVRSFSLHRPHQALLRGPLEVENLVNAYSHEMMRFYISDSRGRWEGGGPVERFLRTKEPVVQLLVHPIWWGPESEEPRSRLQEFYEGSVQGKTKVFRERLDFEIERTVGLRRMGSPDAENG